MLHGGGFEPDNPDLVLISCKEVFLLSEVFNFRDESAIFNNYTNILALVLPFSARNENLPLQAGRLNCQLLIHPATC